MMPALKVKVNDCKIHKKMRPTNTNLISQCCNIWYRQ